MAPPPHLKDLGEGGKKPRSPPNRTAPTLYSRGDREVYADAAVARLMTWRRRRAGCTGPRANCYSRNPHPEHHPHCARCKHREYSTPEARSSPERRFRTEPHESREGRSAG